MGINTIISESETAKASFYQHFPSKASLAQAYLTNEITAQSRFLGTLTAKFTNPTRFMRVWSYCLARQARNGTLLGCPIANFRAQTLHSPGFENLFHSYAHEFTAVLAQYFRKVARAGYLADKNQPPDQIARQVFIIYQGALQAYRLSGDHAYLSEIPEFSRYLFTQD